MSVKTPPHVEPDRGIAFLILFMTAALIVVGGVWLASAIDAWWVLGVVVFCDLALTAAVLLGVFRLLDD